MLNKPIISLQPFQQKKSRSGDCFLAVCSLGGRAVSARTFNITARFQLAVCWHWDRAEVRS